MQTDQNKAIIVPEQTPKSHQQLITAKQQETLDLSKSIISDSKAIAPIEMGLSISQTLDKALVRSVFKAEAGQIGFAVVNVLVTRFIDSFGFSTKLNSTQIETLTVDILESFQYETLEDIIIFLKMARTGKFGSTGRGVDSNLILGDWFPKYLDQKAQVREEIYQKEKSMQAKATEDGAVDLYYAKLSREKAKKLEEQRMKAEIDEMVKSMDKQMLEDTIADWEKKEKLKPWVFYLKTKRQSVR